MKYFHYIWWNIEIDIEYTVWSGPPPKQHVILLPIFYYINCTTKCCVYNICFKIVVIITDVCFVIANIIRYKCQINLSISINEILIRLSLKILMGFYSLKFSNIKDEGQRLPKISGADEVNMMIRIHILKPFKHEFHYFFLY